ncbi:MAG TPA: OsmC family peroxiredoxin [Gaiellaceae bacterium]|jgi:osmotically inducible protein OsmC|nr:OsmC family peroxiredoxin [Gaiellaceae bacterium]
MAAERRADVVWEGSLMEGAGTITKTGSGALPELPVTWASRTESPEGRTSPEELIAAAHAACFAMALSHALAQAGNPAERLETSATVTFVPGTGITRSALTVMGRVPGIDENAFREAAEGAREDCPVSGALKGNVQLELDAQLEA